MKARLSSGAMTGERCACGAAIWSYHQAKHVRGVPLDALDWRWIFVCEAGHWQPEPEAQPAQLSLLEAL